METKHTPGPWNVVGYTTENEVLYCIDKDASINNLASEAKANAKLISAAPYMLAVLELILNDLNANGINADAEHVRIVTAAVNKAKGE